MTNDETNRNRRWTAADKGDLGLERRRQLREIEIRIARLTHAHLHEDLGGKVLETANVDRTFLGTVEIATTDAEIRRRTHHAARQAERVVAKDELSCAIVVLFIQKAIEPNNTVNVCAAASALFRVRKNNQPWSRCS